MKKILFALIALVSLSSCVGKKKFTQLESEYNMVKSDLERCQSERLETQQDLSRRESQLLTTEVQVKELRNQLNATKSQLEYFKNQNDNMLERLADLSVVSKTGAESIKKSLETLQKQNEYIKNLTGKIQTKDSINLVLVMNLKRSLADVDDEDVTIEVKKGVVYISLSDKMLYKSGSAEIQPRAAEVLGKVAKVLNDRKELEILVEGHTDNVPIKTDCMKDNWDLSVKRATSVVRLLQKKYNVDPARMTAGGRSEYLPKTTNQTAAGRQINRRTEIIITPKLDQFFQLLTPETNTTD